MTKFSKTQIDRLGDRLRKGPQTESDLRLLDDYRRSFGQAYNELTRIIRAHGLPATGRSAKSTVSIVDKLRRESIRLSQMQDIAGCRVVVSDVVEQDRIVASLSAAFAGASVIDRRENPSYGYRAVHLIAEIFGKPIEIQVRTSLQHLWAELSEKASDVIEPKIKYGGGPEMWRNVLSASSAWVAAYEKLEKTFAIAVESYLPVEEAAERLLDDQGKQRARDERRVFKEAEERKLRDAWRKTAEHLNRMISWLDDMKRRKQ